MKQNDKTAGFSLVEVTIALVVLLIGILATLSALSFGIVSLQDSEKRSLSKEIARSTMETVFSMRDLLAFDPQTGGSTYNWDAIQIKSGSNQGIFLDGWKPIRESPGADGIFGTADDACDVGSPCIVGATTNNSAVMTGYERKIEITDITENGVVRKRVMTVRVRYFVGQMLREEAESTILANYPIN
jgi:Tfp pilus assembly protein PilV